MIRGKTILTVMRMNNVLLLVFLSCLAGCSAIGPAFTPAPPPNLNEARVYIYRMPNMAFSLADTKFYLNEVNVVDLYCSGYCALTLAPGIYAFKQEWPVLIVPDWEHEKAIKLPLHVRGGETYYIRFAAQICEHTVNPCVEWRITMPDARVALAELKQCKLQSPKNLDKLNPKKAMAEPTQRPSQKPSYKILGNPD